MAKWRLIAQLIAVLVVLPLGVGGLLYELNRHGFFDLKSIEIVLEESERNSLYLKPLIEKLDNEMEKNRGVSLWALDLSKISDRVQAQSWVDVHSLSRQWPNGLRIRIRPHEVKFLLVGAHGKLVPVLSDGRLLDPVEAKVAPDVTLLEGDSFQRHDLRKKAVDAIEEIPKDGSFSRRTISEMKYDPREGFTLRLERTGTRIKIGDDLIPLKSARVSQVLDYLSNRDMTAETIDANLSKKVLVRLREKDKTRPEIKAVLE